MKLNALAVFRVNPAQPNPESTFCLAGDFDVSEAPFFYRSRVKELALFNCKLCAANNPPLSRRAVKNQPTNSLISCDSSFCNGRICIVAVTTLDYTSRVTFDLLRKVGQQFEAAFRGRWETVEKDDGLSWPELAQMRKEFEDGSADQINQIKEHLEQTKVTMIDSIDAAMARGQRIDDLVDKSALLSDEARDLHKTSKKMNSWCCSIQ